MNQPTLTFFQESAASHSQPIGPTSARSASVKSSHIASRSSQKTSTVFLPTLTAGNKHSDYSVTELGGSKNPLRSIPTFADWTDDDTGVSLCLQQEFPVSLRVAPGSVEAQRMTAGFGRKLYESLVKHSRLSPCLKTLLASVLSTEDWHSNLCFLRWRASATKSARRLLFQLVPSEPATGAIESSLLPTLKSADSDKNLRSPEGMAKEMERKRLGADLATVMAMLPTLSARDWRSEKSNMHGQNSRPLSEVTGLSGLKLTSAFCERFMGFPENWTAIDEPESTHSATRSSRRKPTRSSKPSMRS